MQRAWRRHPGRVERLPAEAAAKDCACRNHLLAAAFQRLDLTHGGFADQRIELLRAQSEDGAAPASTRPLHLAQTAPAGRTPTMTETDSILPDLSGDGAATGAALANDTAPELPPLAIAPPRFMPPRPDDPSGENAPPDQAEPRPTIDIEYPHPPAGDRTQGEPGIGNDPGFAITPKNPAGGNIDPGFDITPKNLPVSPYPQGRLADPIQRWSQPSTLADPINRQYHYYGSLVDRADDYKAINGYDPSGDDLATIQAQARAEAFHPGETPLALFANAAATPVAASAPAAPAQAPATDPPVAGDAGPGEQVAVDSGAASPTTAAKNPPATPTAPTGDAPQGQGAAASPAPQGAPPEESAKPQPSPPVAPVGQSKQEAGAPANGSFDKDKFAATLDKNAGSTSSGKCGKFVRQAFDAAGMDTTDRPASGSAKDWGPVLEKKGFTPVDNTGYVPQKGDVVVFQTYDGAKRPNGHIAGYDGAQWVSDFKQPDIWPSNAYKNANASSTVYRHP